MKPAKCRFCGKEEWRHICGGLMQPFAAVKTATSHPEVLAAKLAAPVKTDRKAYLAQKAKERRKRQKAHKAKP